VGPGRRGEGTTAGILRGLRNLNLSTDLSAPFQNASLEYVWCGVIVRSLYGQCNNVIASLVEILMPILTLAMTKKLVPTLSRKSPYITHLKG
jgi:hypothetical protein